MSLVSVCLLTMQSYEMSPMIARAGGESRSSYSPGACVCARALVSRSSFVVHPRAGAQGCACLVFVAAFSCPLKLRLPAPPEALASGIKGILLNLHNVHLPNRALGQASAARLQSRTAAVQQGGGKLEEAIANYARAHALNAAPRYGVRWSI